MSTNITESIWILRQAVRWGRVQLWASILLEMRCFVLTTWVQEISEEDHLGPMEEVLRYAVVHGQPVVLRLVDMILRTLHKNTSRLDEPEDEEMSDLVTVVSYIVDLAPSLSSDVWPVIGDIHPVHLNGVPVESVLRLLDHACSPADAHTASYFLDFLLHWFRGFGTGLHRVWNTDLQPRLEDLHRLIEACKAGTTSDRTPVTELVELIHTLASRA